MYYKIIICLCFTSIAAVYGKTARIIGGEPADFTEFPYQASLKRYNDDFVICGGAIISRRHVLTTAHCVNINYVKQETLIITLGNGIMDSTIGSVHYPLIIFPHPYYTGTPDSTLRMHFDIAVVKVRDFIEFNAFQNKISLPTRDISDGDVAIVSGYGSTDCPPIRPANGLKKALMSILGYQTCSSQLTFPITVDTFCASQRPGVGVCRGDGGNPLVKNKKLLGLVLASRLYATGEPELYVNVFSHLDFIREIIKGY